MKPARSFNLIAISHPRESLESRAGAEGSVRQPRRAGLGALPYNEVAQSRRRRVVHAGVLVMFVWDRPGRFRVKPGLAI